jgi:hypothetical protein
MEFIYRLIRVASFFLTRKLDERIRGAAFAYGEVLTQSVIRIPVSVPIAEPSASSF